MRRPIPFVTATCGLSTFPRRLPCGYEHLTAVGAQQHLENGALLGAAYRRALGLGGSPQAAHTAGQLRVIATDFNRAVVSAQAIVAGMFLAAHTHPMTA